MRGEDNGKRGSLKQYYSRPCILEEANAACTDVDDDDDGDDDI